VKADLPPEDIVAIFNLTGEAAEKMAKRLHDSGQAGRGDPNYPRVVEIASPSMRRISLEIASCSAMLLFRFALLFARKCIPEINSNLHPEE